MIEAEAERVADLKAYCQKKGKNFDIENQKYLDKEAKKRAKIEAKVSKKNKK